MRRLLLFVSHSLYCCAAACSFVESGQSGQVVGLAVNEIAEEVKRATGQDNFARSLQRKQEGKALFEKYDFSVSYLRV